MAFVKNRTPFLGSLIAALVFIQIVTIQAVTEFYVAPDGKDANAGTIAHPFATLERARNAVREQKKRENGLKNPATIILRRGTYYLSRTLMLTPEDSGTEACPITWQGMSNETAVIDGGERISSPWSSSDGKIYSTVIPGAQKGNWHFRQLFVDGHREIQARYPNFIPNDEGGFGQLYVGGGCQILMGLAAPGDWVAFPFEVKAAGDYALWIGCATAVSNAQKRLTVTIDGKPAQVSGEIIRSADWRTVRYSRLGSVPLGAGKHTIRLDSSGAKVHLCQLVLTSRLDGALEDDHGLTPLESGEQRITIEAENTIGRSGNSSSGFTTAPAETGQKLDRTTILTRGKIKASWTNDPEAMIDLVPGLHYFNAFVSIDSIDPAKGLIKIEGPECQEAIRAGNYFYVEGVREELDEPGEWYLDSRSGRLDYEPRAGKNPNQSEVIAPRLDRLMELKGDAEGTNRVRWVQIKNLTFRHCADTLNHVALRTPTDAALKLDCACNCTVEDCIFENIDGFGIWLHLDSC
ncbi:MAG TPA: hypothetical protein VN761_07735, partial [Candidatus Polarisedimenticolia bacterium]|nr:hypothetical protein [Candidatus Polarisedimenticolia bacterium]